MTVGLGAAGSLGFGFEALAAVGTYVVPTKFIPIEEESLMFNQPITKRRPIQGVVDPVDSKLGAGHVEGSIKMAAYHDSVPYFLYIARTGVTKTGAGPYTYTCLGSHVAQGPYSASLTVVRNGVVFGYTGCYVTSQDWSVEEGILMVEFGILGFDETTQSAPSESYDSLGNEFQAGQYTIEYADTATATIDTIGISIDDNGQAVDRLSSTSGADLIHFGERTTTVSVDRDFEDRTEYDLFRATTPQKFEFIADNSSETITIHIPQAVASGYEIPLSGQGALVRASIEYEADYDATLTSGYEIVVETDEDIVVPT